MMTSAQIRQSFLDFFKERKHIIVPSSSLLPDSPNLLFTNAGMNQFVPIFLGQKKADSPRVADTQKCIRAGGKHNDLEDVGLDTYHHTFFEMLGNWSFGDYFKKEAIEWAWELVVEKWKFPPSRLYATVYSPDKTQNDPSEFDQEAWDCWAEKFRAAGLDPNVHIVSGSKKDNFWMMGETGPCGPCSELHADLTPEGNTKGSLVNKGDARCIEIWNLVFIQFNANPDGTFSPLPARHVDTGMGFERVTSILQCTKGFTNFGATISNYETDIFRPIFDEIEKLSGKKYGSTLPSDLSGTFQGGTGYQPVLAGNLPASASGTTYSKRNLPHFEKPWAIYVVNFQTYGGRKLSPAARDVVFDCIIRWRESRYRLVAACVMPDHVHMILQPGIKEADSNGEPIFWPLSEILHSIKSFSAKEINKLENTSGILWQDERYDRYIRSAADLQEKFRYVCGNPWAAGIVDEKTSYRWLWTQDIEAASPYVAPSTLPYAKIVGQVAQPNRPVACSTQTEISNSGGTGYQLIPAGNLPVGSGAEQIALDIAFRVIADHIRTLSFAIADGIQPSNEGRGYVLRRILRRAVRYGRTLGFHEPFFYKLVDVLADTMGDVFPEIRARKKQVQETIRTEEEAFNKTLDRGIDLFERAVKYYKAGEEMWRRTLQNNPHLPDGGLNATRVGVPEENKTIEAIDYTPYGGKVRAGFAFKLYDTYGFPLDLTELMARERGLTVDKEGFNKLMDQQKARARAAQKKEVISLSQIETTAPTKFVGFDHLAAEAKVLEVVSLKEKTAVVLDTSPFYAEMGGQVGDTGEISGGGNLWRISNTQKSGNTWLHFIGDAGVSEADVNRKSQIVNVSDIPVVGSGVTLTVDKGRRSAIQRHHTVTHLLHWALHEVVSKDASQKGSFVGPDKLTFDFNSAPLTPQQVADIEKLVNERILENAGVSWTEVPYADVKARKDVMQFFGDKYGDTVRVVQIGGRAGELNGYSMELCGGTHVRATGEIGLFRIVGESAIAAGVRRIEAVAGLEAYRRANEDLHLIKAIAGRVNAPVHELDKKIESMLAHQKELEREVKIAMQRNASNAASELLERVHIVNDIPLIAHNLGEAEPDFLQAIADSLKGRFKGVIVLGGYREKAVTLIAAVTPEFTARIQAGKIIQQIAPLVGGKGGGKPDNARGGGKDAGKLDEALAKAKSLIA